MSIERSRDCLLSLMHELCALTRESERVAFHSGRHCDGGPWRAAPKLMGYLAFWPSTPREGQA